METTPKNDLVETYHYFVSGYSILTETIFNYKNLSNGCFTKYVCKSNFTYDSEYFNNCLSRFVKNLNVSGRFFISTDVPTTKDIVIDSNFDPLLLNGQIENYDIRLKLVPTFLYDEKRRWCIYLHNDFDIFIVWVDNSFCRSFETYFNRENDDFYLEPNDATYLDIMIARLFPTPEPNDLEPIKNTIIANNGYLFQSRK
jgi:hypothetical protein